MSVDSKILKVSMSIDKKICCGNCDDDDRLFMKMLGFFFVTLQQHDCSNDFFNENCNAQEQ